MHALERGCSIIPQELRTLIELTVGVSFTKARLGLRGETELDIGEPTLVTGKTEIACNSSSFAEKK